MKTRLWGIAVIFCFVMLMSPVSLAAENEFKMENTANIQGILHQNMGKRVTVTLESGQEISGIVRTVGDHLVQLSEPPQKEFFDVLVRIDQIDSIMLRVRGK